MKQRLVVLVLAFLLPGLAGSRAYAQEQRGAIQGTVKDASGGILPGVLFEAASPALVGGASTVADAKGEYAFAALPPGVYTVTASLAGFTTTKVPNIDLPLGKTLRVDFTLAVASVAETVTVSSETPLIDITRSAVATSFGRKDFDLLPKGRDFSTVATLAPGANAEAKLGGISIDGASGAENVFYVDGMDVTQLTTGAAGKSVILDEVDQVQVKSSGYDAEYGGAIGGVVNIITRSGSNDFKGEANVYFSGSALTARPNQTLRLGLTNSNIAESVRYPEDPATLYEPGFMLGGPLKRDRIWFFGSYFPQLQSTDRSVTFLRDGSNQTITSTQRTHAVLGKVSAQISPKLRATVSYNTNPTHIRGTLPKQDGTDTPTFPFASLGEDDQNSSTAANLDVIVSPKVYVNFRGGYFSSNQESIGVPNEVNYIFNSSNLTTAGVPDDLRRPTGFSVVPTNSGTTRNLQTRLTFNGDITWDADFAGRHHFKSGYQFTRLGSDVLMGDQQNNITLFWGQAYTARTDGQRYTGPFGYYNYVQFFTQGAVHSNNIGVFLQDSWRIGNRLTINAGLRDEREEIPSFNAKGGTAITWGFGDKLAPRLGATYDILGDGKWKLYGGYGKFYDAMKLSLPQNAFGGAHRLTYYYTLDTPNWPTLGANGVWPGKFVEVIDGRPDRTGAIDPGIQPVQSREFSAGLERELMAHTSLGLRYVHKNLVRTIEDTGWVGASGSTEYIIGNPGFGQTANVLQFSKNQGGFPAGATDIPVLPKARRDYDAVEVRLTRRFANRWSANVAYTWSRLFGNYTGLVASDELSATGQGRLSPNGTGSYDQAYNVFGPSEDGLCCSEPLYRHLPTDRPHQVKGQLLYLFGKGFSAGANYYISSGTPVIRSFWKTNDIFFGGDLSDGRTPVLSQTDVNLRYEMGVGGNKRLQLSLNVLNLFDQRTITARYFTMNKTSTGASFTDPAFFGGTINVPQLIASENLQLDPRFLQPLFFQNPRSAIASARLTF